MIVLRQPDGSTGGEAAIDPLEQPQARRRVPPTPSLRQLFYLRSTALAWAAAGLLVGLNWAGALLVWLQRHHTSLPVAWQAGLALLLVVATSGLGGALRPRPTSRFRRRRHVRDRLWVIGRGR